MLSIKHFLSGLNVGETWCSAIVTFHDTVTALSFEKETHRVVQRSADLNLSTSLSFEGGSFLLCGC